MPAVSPSGAGSGSLPELATVYWRPRVDPLALRRSGRLWTLFTFAHSAPFFAVPVLLPALKPLTLPVALIALAHAWIIPELYAARGANVLRPRRRGAEGPEKTALGFLGDLVGGAARELLLATGLVLERGRLGAWVVGEAGAVLVPSGGPRGRVYCYCVRVTGDDLPSGDRIAHLLLALREDEAGFATVANLTFAGARWRLARRLTPSARSALALAGRAPAAP